MGWFVDEPWYGFPGGGGMRTRLMHVSVGVPDEEVQKLQGRWASRNASWAGVDSVGSPSSRD